MQLRQLECLCFWQEEPPDEARVLRAHRTATLTFLGWCPELKGSGEPLGKYGENWTSVTLPRPHRSDGVLGAARAARGSPEAIVNEVATLFCS